MAKAIRHPERPYPPERHGSIALIGGLYDNWLEPKVTRLRNWRATLQPFVAKHGRSRRIESLVNISTTDGVSDKSEEVTSLQRVTCERRPFADLSGTQVSTSPFRRSRDHLGLVVFWARPFTTSLRLKS
jgi:hypothetical protein